MINNIIPFRPLRRRPPPTDPQWIAAYLRYWAESLDRLTDYIAQLNAQDVNRQDRESLMSDLRFDYPADEPSMIATRTFDAPRELVWRVFTTPEHIARWWGPQSIAPVKRVDKLELRPGGTWRYICERPDGSQQIVFTGEYLDVDAPQKLVNTFGVEGQFAGDAAFPETHTFEDRGGKTFYRSYTLLPSLEVREQVLATGMEKGGRESIEQLAALIEELKADAR